MKGQSIGRKIKALRTKLNEENKDIYISQDALYKDHQGLISQIEGEKIIHPNRETLEIVAKNLGRSLEELIEDTNWDPKKAKVITSEYAFSRTQAMVKLDESGQIHITMQSYPRYNEKGDENMFSPETGERLISTCENRDWRTDSEDLAEEPCGRTIESATQRHCMSCGYSLLPEVQLPRIEKRDFWYNIESNEYEQDRIEGIIDYVQEQYSKLYEIDDGYELGAYIFPVRPGQPPEFIDPDDFWHGLKSTDFLIVKWFEKYFFKQTVLSGLLKELKRHQLQIISGEVKPPTIGQKKDKDKGQKQEDRPINKSGTGPTNKTGKGKEKK
jgi:hypothetical protein